MHFQEKQLCHLRCCLPHNWGHLIKERICSLWSKFFPLRVYPMLGRLRPPGGRSGRAMALGKLPVPWRPTVWMVVGQGPTALAVGAGGGCLDIFTLIYPFFPLSPSLWKSARYRLKYRLKGPLIPKQPTNQSSSR